jgi:hypothetical protein
VLSTAVLGGCGAEGGDRAGGVVRPDVGAAIQGPSTQAPADDAALCAAFSDVLTIVENANVGLADGRMAAQEQLGWHELATRVLDRLPSGGDSAVQTAIGELQDAAPAAPSGELAESSRVRSPEWSQAENDLAAACEEVGAPLAISMFTGG